MFKRTLSNLLRIHKPSVNGLKLPLFRSPFDYILGDGNVKLDYKRSNGQWADALPVNENQNRGFETYSCVSQAANNCIEIWIKALTGTEVNFSDRALAKLSGTDRSKGNSFVRVAETIRTKGLVLEESWPFEGTRNWNDFYRQVSTNILEAAKLWLQQYEYKYQWIGPNGVLKTDAIIRALQYGPVQTSYLYNSIKNSKGYYTSRTTRANHSAVIVGYKMNEYWEVFDTYAPHLKRFTWDTMFISGLQHIVRMRTKMPLYKTRDSAAVYAQDARGVLHAISDEHTFYKGFIMGMWDDWESVSVLTNQAFNLKPKADVSIKL